MDFDFAKSMQDTSDTELIKILTTDRGDYQEAALIAAGKELARRNLSGEQVASANEINEAQKAIKDKKANVPLDVHWKILAVVFPGLLLLIISGIFKGDGYERKSAELAKWTFIGVAVYIVVIAIAVAGGG